MNDFYEDQPVWCLLRSSTGRAGYGAYTLEEARRRSGIDYDDGFFAARWDADACQWVKAHEEATP